MLASAVYRQLKFHPLGVLALSVTILATSMLGRDMWGRIHRVWVEITEDITNHAGA